jgi:DNA-binding SARP family transcriptional activator
MEFRILGPLEVWDGGHEVPLGGRRPRALLAALLLHPNEVVPAERLIDELWGDEARERAAAALRVNVSRLRKSLPQEVLRTRSPGYVLHVEHDELDLQRFERLVDEGRSLLARGLAADASKRLRDALARWRGPPLADFAYESFAQAAIARLEEIRVAAVELRIDADLLLGRHDELVGELEALVAENPLRERLRAQLMTALYRSGRQAEALEAYQDARRTSTSWGSNQALRSRSWSARSFAKTARSISKQPDRRPRPAWNGRFSSRSPTWTPRSARSRVPT